LYFLNENVLHLHNKTKPCFLARIIDFLSPKVAALLFVNSQIDAFVFTKILCSENLAAKLVWRYISLVFRLCYPNWFIPICIHLKSNEETNALERKVTLHFCFGKTETSAQPGTELCNFKPVLYGFRIRKTLFCCPKDILNTRKQCICAPR